MGLGSFLFGQEAKTKQLPTKNPQQLDILKQLLGSFGQKGPGGQGGGLSQLLQLLQGQLEPGSEAENAFAAPLMRQFNEETLPGIAERFAGAGALSSSGFGQSLSSAGSGLQEKLGQLRGGIQQNAISQLMQLLGTGLGTDTFAYQEKPASPGFLTSALGSGLGSYLGGRFGG